MELDAYYWNRSLVRLMQSLARSFRVSVHVAATILLLKTATVMLGVPLSWIERGSYVSQDSIVFEGDAGQLLRLGCCMTKLCTSELAEIEDQAVDEHVW